MAYEGENSVLHVECEMLNKDQYETISRSPLISTMTAYHESQDEHDRNRGEHPYAHPRLSFATLPV